MENSFQTSFIPKKPVSDIPSVRAKSSGGILYVVAGIILVSVGLWSGGLFLYKNVLVKQKDSLIRSLNLSRDSFEQQTINELDLFNKKISVSNEIMKNHTVISPLFEVINNITIPSVQFIDFNYQVSEGGYFVVMSGLARDYTSIALQAKEFNSINGKYFKNVVFSGLNLSDNDETKGYVNFDVSFNVDKNLLSYENNVILENAKTKEDTSGIFPSSNTIKSQPILGQ